MKFFQGYNKLTLDDIACKCNIVRTGRCKTTYGAYAPLDGTYRVFGNSVIIADCGCNGTERRLLHRTDECDSVQKGNMVNSWGRDREFINLKYVPAKVKNADYPDSEAYLNAVMDHINGRKDKAKGKLLIQKHNNNASAQLNFLDAQSIIDEVTAKAGWVPTPADAWMKKHRNVETLNELYKKQGRTEFEYRKDRLHTMKFEIQKSKKNLAKITITGLDAEKSQEILTALFGFMGE